MNRIIVLLQSPYGKIRYYSDFNRDGGRDILDATCIRRCLAGLSYKSEKPNYSITKPPCDQGGFSLMI